MSDFSKKVNLFNDFFATQCTPLTNSSVLLSTISFKTHSRLTSISFKKEDILKIIRNLNVNKAHGHDDISIQMLKLCDSEVVESLSLIYKNCIDSVIFPDIWKRPHIILTYKKMINVLLTITVLFVYYQFAAKYLNVYYTILYFYTWKIMSCLLHINLAFTLMTHVYQLIPIVHNIYADFDHNPSLEVRGNFLNISKAFAKVWHKGLLYKI